MLGICAGPPRSRFYIGLGRNDGRRSQGQVQQGKGGPFDNRTGVENHETPSERGVVGLTTKK